MPEPIICRAESTERRWTIPVDGGYEPIGLKVNAEDGVARLSVGAISTGPSELELLALMQACAEAVAALRGRDPGHARAIMQEAGPCQSS